MDSNPSATDLFVVKVVLMFEKPENWSRNCTKDTSGQSYKASTIVIYDSRVVPDLKIPHIMTLDSKITIINCL